MKEEMAHKEEAISVRALTALRTFDPIREPLGMSGLKEGAAGVVAK
jgi:hypothetical protein